jgi:hypothetical protein
MSGMYVCMLNKNLESSFISHQSSFTYQRFALLLKRHLNARWPRKQYAQRPITEDKQRSQWSVIDWVTKIYYLELLRASEGTLSWSRLHLQSMAPRSMRFGVRSRKLSNVNQSFDGHPSIHRAPPSSIVCTVRGSNLQPLAQ